jgi:hypothetical protein
VGSLIELAQWPGPMLMMRDDGGTIGELDEVWSTLLTTSCQQIETALGD